MKSNSSISKYLQEMEKAQTLVEKYDIQNKAFESLNEHDSDYLYDILWESHKYVIPQTVHMGLNTIKGDPNWELLKSQIRDIVERDGICQASWSCDGRTRHMWQSQILESDMTEYDFEIGYNYKCEIRKR